MKTRANVSVKVLLWELVILMCILTLSCVITLENEFYNFSMTMIDPDRSMARFLVMFFVAAPVLFVIGPLWVDIIKNDSKTENTEIKINAKDMIDAIKHYKSN